MFRAAIAVAAGLVLCEPGVALAQQQPTVRVLAVPADSSWKHAETEIILPPRLDGMSRAEIQDSTADELDVFATYRSEDGAVATVFLFKTGLPEASIWFDRALHAVQHNPQIKIAPGPPRLAPFTPAGRSSGGLTAAHDLAGGGGTALAVVPAAENFLLKVRLTSAGHGGAQLAERIQRLLSAVRWPQWSGEQPGAVAVIQPCPVPLRTQRARELREDLSASLMSGIIGLVRSKPGPGSYCREAGATPIRGVYRFNAATDAYVIALGDAGLAISAGPALDLPELTGQRSRRGTTSLSLLEREGVAVLPSFNRLPPPDQAVETARSGRSKIRMQTR